MNRTTSDQFAPRTNTATMMQTIPERKPVRSIFVLLSASRPLPNFMANIGISLTSSAERTIAMTGMKYHVPQSELNHEYGESST